MAMSRVLAVALLGFAGLAAQAAVVPTSGDGILSVTGQGKVEGSLSLHLDVRCVSVNYCFVFLC